MPTKRPRKTTPSSTAKSGDRSPKPAATRRARATTSKKKPAATPAPTKRASAKTPPKKKLPARAADPQRTDLLKPANAAGITGRQRLSVAKPQAALARLATRAATAPVRNAEVRPLVGATRPPVAGLPWHYGGTEIIAMPVDPLLVHVYWELLPEEVARVRGALGSAWDGAQQVLRAYEVTAASAHHGDGAELVAHARHHFDSDVGGDVGSYYVHLWSPEHTLIFELGWRSRAGRFMAAARSNMVRTPRNAPCGGEERWMTVRNGRIVTTPPGAIPGGDAAAHGPEPDEPAPWSATFPAHRGWGGRR